MLNTAWVDILAEQLEQLEGLGVVDLAIMVSIELVVLNF